MTKHSVNEQQYTIQSAEITTDRILPNEFYDVTKLIVELTLFEDIEKPYCTGKVMLKDDSGLMDKIGFSGTERLTIEIGIPPIGNFENLKRTFIMSGIENVAKANQSGNSSIFVINLVDPHAYFNKSKKISQSYEGNLENSITNILTNHLDVRVENFAFEESIQTNFKYIIPYMHPLEACDWLRERATTNTGMPYFLYPSINFENILFLSDLSTMLTEDPVNAEDEPFIYNPENTQRSQSDTNNISNMYNIESLKTSVMQNTYQQLTSGSIGAEYNNLDIATGLSSNDHFSLKRMLDDLDYNEVIDIDKQNVYDDEYLFRSQFVEDRSLHDASAKVYHTITSKGTYGTFKSYGEEKDSRKYLTKLRNRAMRNALYKNMIDITVSGAFFNMNQCGVGSLINVNVLSDDVNNKEYNFDELRSGKYLIYNVRHTYRDTVHKVAMTLCKLERGNYNGVF